MPENTFKKLKLLDLFSGISVGGFSLGLERSGGFKTVAFCEIEKYPRQILAKHWPEVPCYEDIRSLNAATLQRDGIEVDAICGGFPCQDISTAGKGAGIEGERSGLWTEYARLIGELRPRLVFVENVAALLGRGLDKVLGDLASLGYDAEWHCIPASAIGAPHRRDRIWVIAYPKSKRSSKEGGLQRERTAKRSASCGKASLFTDAIKKRIQGQSTESFQGQSAFSWCQNVRRAEELRGRSDIPQSTFRGSRDGVPNWMDRLAGLGNAVVPQIPELLGRAVMDAMPDLFAGFREVPALSPCRPDVAGRWGFLSDSEVLR